MTTSIGAYATRAAVETRLGGTFSAAEDALIDTICDQVNMEVETTTKRAIAPISSATYLFDGDGTRVLRIPIGVRAVTLLEMAQVTGAAFTTIPSTDYFLRPTSQDRRPGFPADEIWLSDLANGGFFYFPRGIANVRVTMAAGFPAITDDIVRIATESAVRAWHARQVGQAEGEDAAVGAMATHFLSRREREILSVYSASRPGLY